VIPDLPQIQLFRNRRCSDLREVWAISAGFEAEGPDPTQPLAGAQTTWWPHLSKPRSVTLPAHLRVGIEFFRYSLELPHKHRSSLVGLIDWGHRPLMFISTPLYRRIYICLAEYVYCIVAYRANRTVTGLLIVILAEPTPSVYINAAAASQRSSRFIPHHRHVRYHRRPPSYPGGNTTRPLVGSDTLHLNVSHSV
jgi:hypothetical protein